jgi:hypothetical protein
MTMCDILTDAPGVLGELTRELLRRGNEEYEKDNKSQATACLFLAVRSASLLVGMAKVLTPQTRDSLEVLVRGFIESRDLLMTFRFDHKGTRDKIGYWFEGKLGNSWKAEHKKCEEFMEKLGIGPTEFGKRWSMTTTLAHPTVFASHNSVFSASLWAATPPRVEDFNAMMEPKVADYLTNIGSLIVIAIHNLPGLISLNCDLKRMPSINAFRENVFTVVVPILNKTNDGDLPPDSYRQ